MNEKLKTILSNEVNVPKNEREQAQLKKFIEFREIGELDLTASLSIPRYLVTYMNSQTRGNVRSATVVSVTNQSDQTNRVTVSYFKGFSSNSSPVGSTTYSIPPDYTIDFCTRNLPGTLTVCNSVPSPELVFDEGRAIVSSTLPEIGVSSRVYYTSGGGDEELLSITDSNIVAYGKGNQGD